MTKIMVEVCAGTHCTLMGAMDIIHAVEGLRELYQKMNPDCEIEVRPISCKHICDNMTEASIVIINGEPLLTATPEIVMESIMNLAANFGCVPM
jgi:NADH:ubiquinone oxidoreductase subunit E